MTDCPRGRARLARPVVVITLGLAVSACGSGLPSPAASSAPLTAQPPSPSPSPSPSPAPAAEASPSPSPLAGKVIGIDPGHNGGNFTDPGAISKQVWNGREWESCDTTGTDTAGGYTEALFNFNVARYLRADLRRDGARVVLTRTTNNGVGPCVDRRAQIINQAGANVAIDIHADGGPPTGRGFTVLEPVADGPNDSVVASSQQFGRDVRQVFLAGTVMPVSTYEGVNGIMPRNDLAGLNLTRVPKVLIECGNMRNATDASLLVSGRFQRQVAGVLTAAIIRFLGPG
ncbi:MAG TPA: N-acetylmuramoyl-L-alanine amidase [Streptosporangiaceae bacterium]